MKKHLSEFGESREPITPSQETELAWLSGIIDGEGTIGLYKTKRGDMMYRLSIVNTDLGILDNVKKILNNLSISININMKATSYHIYERSFIGRKPCYEIVIGKRDILQNLLPKIIPYLFGYKNHKARNLLTYLIEHPRRRRKIRYCKVCNKIIPGKHLSGKYCSQECFHKFSVGENNPNYRKGLYVLGVETKRETPVMDEAIVRSLQECKEFGRNDQTFLSYKVRSNN